MEQHFWEPANGLYADEATPDWRLSAYRGQNANMHACGEPRGLRMTRDARYLQRALTLAESVTGRLMALADGLVWEHYRVQGDGAWAVDWDYNRDDKTNIFRPGASRPATSPSGPSCCCSSERALPEAERPPGSCRVRAASSTPRWRAAGTMNTAAWSTASGDGAVCDADKYFWVQAELGRGRAARAAQRRRAPLADLRAPLGLRLAHFVDHQHGAWYRILGPPTTAS